MPNIYPLTLVRSSQRLLLALLVLPSAAFGQTTLFAPVVAYASGPPNATPYNLAVADVNGDGKRDVLVANYGTSTLGVLLGNGNGGFTLLPSSPSTGPSSGPYTVVIADVNGDGKPDALTSNYYAGTLGVLLGNGSGGFTLLPNSPATVTGATGPSTFITVADVNGDTKPDVVASNLNTGTLGILLGDGSGGFVLQPNSPPTGTVTSNPAMAVVADVNGDGKPDVVVANFVANTLGILLGNGLGGFTLQANGPSTGTNSHPLSLALADVNGDGKLDALTTNSQTSTLGVLLGNGNGGFTLQANSPSTGVVGSPNGLALSDVNGDGKLDALTTNLQANTLGVLLGNGNGSFMLQASSPSTGAGSSPRGLVVADINGDGKPDALTANSQTGTIGVFLTGTMLATRAALPGSKVTLAPNPAHTSALLLATGLPAGVSTVQVTLLTSVGQRVYQLSVPAVPGGAQATIPISGLVPGLYILHLSALDARGTALGALPTQRLSVE